MYRIQILDAGARDLSRLDHSVARRVVGRIRWLSDNLDAIKPTPLTGELSGLYRLRVGDFRVLYQILDAEQMIVIHQIGHRRDIYRPR